MRSGEPGPVGALVFGSGYTALGIVRSLGRRGIPVWVIASRSSPAGASRYARKAIALQGETAAEQVEFLVELSRQHGLKEWALFPDSDKGVALIAHYHAVLGEHYALTSPEWSIARWAIDKHLTYEVAQELGIDYPCVYHLHRVGDPGRQAGVFPMVLKPADHQSADRFSIISGAWKANDGDELASLYDQAIAVVPDASVVLIQEMVPGGGEAQFSYAALCDEGRVLACTTAQRKRTLPIDFGASTYVETREAMPEIETAARRWLGRVKYTGLVEVDFKFDTRSGRYKMLDVNIRAWGWHAACVHAGVDFPFLMWKLVRGEDVPRVTGRAGVRWARTVYDLASALKLIQRGRLSITDYVKSLRGVHHEMYVLDDLMPAIVEVPLLVTFIWKGLRGR